MEKINILFAGDFCIRGEGVKNLQDEKIEEISSVIKEKTKQYDISMVNVETVFTDELSPIKKSGPNIASPIKALDFLKKMGFTIGALANNHICDQGEEKALASKKLIEDIGLYTIGYGKNLKEANNPIRIEKKGKKISILNFAENEFNPATESTAGFAPIDYYENSKLIKEEHVKSDFVFVMLHAGSEHCPFPRSGLKKLTHFFIDSGADAVIISHPHIAQGYEYYNNKPIVYSMGNFFMSTNCKEKSFWNFGYLASIVINEDNKIEFTPIPYEFDSHGEYFKFLDGEDRAKFITHLNELCDIVNNTDGEDYKKLEYAWGLLYMKATWNGFLEEMSHDKSYDGEFMRANKNFFCCESHQEVIQNFFTVLVAKRLDEFENEKEKIIKWQKTIV